MCKSSYLYGLENSLRGALIALLFPTYPLVFTILFNPPLSLHVKGDCYLKSYH